MSEFYQYVIRDWTPPVLTADGVMGGDNFAVSASSVSTDYNQYAFHQFRGAVDSLGSGWIGNAPTQWFTFYNPNPLNITEIVLGDNNGTTTYLAKNFTFQGSNDNYTWTTLYTNSSRTTGNLTISLPDNTNYYKYHRFYITSVVSGSATLLRPFRYIKAKEKVLNFKEIKHLSKETNKDFSGSLQVISSETKTVICLKAGEVGLNFLIAICFSSFS